MAPTCTPWHLNYASSSSPSKALQLPSPPGADLSVAKTFKNVASTRPKAALNAAINPMEDPLAALGFAPSSLRMKRAWDFAISPAKSLPMQAFMLYMSGSGVQIFSMGTVWMLLSNPVTAVSKLNTAFTPFERGPTAKKDEDTESLLMPKLMFIFCQCLTLALGLWKCNQMGLIPTGSADFLAFETRGPAPEKAYFPATSWGR